MSRRVAELTTNALEDLPFQCKRCLFWEFGAARPVDVDDELAGDPLVQKAAWWRSLELGEVEGSPSVPGRTVRVDGQVVGWCLFGPPEAFAPRRAPVPRMSKDALFLATLWVEPPFRGGNLGRMLLHAAIKEALRTHRVAVEAYGDRRHREGTCVLPGTWLLHEGFAVHREHPRYPLLRLDVRNVARVGDTIELAIDAVLAQLRSRRPEPAPEHVSRVTPSRTAPAPRSGTR